MNIENQVKNIKEQIIKKYAPEKIIIFGSYLKGEFNQDSDLDFLIIKRNVPENGIDRIREISNLIEREIAVDFLVYQPEEIEERIKLGDPFIKDIINTGKTIYG